MELIYWNEHVQHRYGPGISAGIMGCSDAILGGDPNEGPRLVPDRSLHPGRDLLGRLALDDAWKKEGQ